MNEDNIRKCLSYLKPLGTGWDKGRASNALIELSNCFNRDMRINIFISLQRAVSTLSGTWESAENDNWGDLFPYALREQILKAARIEFTPQFIGLVGKKYCLGLRSLIKKSIYSSIHFKRRNMFRSGYYDVFDFAVFLMILNTYDFPDFRKNIKFLCHVFNGLIESRVACIVMKEEDIYALKFPDLILDESRRLHSLIEPALRWTAYDFSYWIQGVRFPHEIWEIVAKKNIQHEDLLEIIHNDNIEVRNVAFRVLGATQIFKNYNFKLIHKTGKNKLYSLAGVFNEPLKVLQYKCPSTNREYFKFVPPQMTNADHAQAWSFQITPEEYQSIDKET